MRVLETEQEPVLRIEKRGVRGVVCRKVGGKRELRGRSLCSTQGPGSVQVQPRKKGMVEVMFWRQK